MEIYSIKGRMKFGVTWGFLLFSFVFFCFKDSRFLDSPLLYFFDRYGNSMDVSSGVKQAKSYHPLLEIPPLKNIATNLRVNSIYTHYLRQPLQNKTLANLTPSPETNHLRYSPRFHQSSYSFSFFFVTRFPDSGVLVFGFVLHVRLRSDG